VRGMLCGTAVPAVIYDGVGGMRSVPQIFSGMTRLATLAGMAGKAVSVGFGVGRNLVCPTPRKGKISDSS